MSTRSTVNSLRRSWCCGAALHFSQGCGSALHFSQGCGSGSAFIFPSRSGSAFNMLIQIQERKFEIYDRKKCKEIGNKCHLKKVNVTLLYEFKLKQQISYDNLFRSLFKNLEKLAEFFYFCAILLQTALLLPKKISGGSRSESALQYKSSSIQIRIRIGRKKLDPDSQK